MVFATFLGGSGGEDVWAAAIDSSGSNYIAGVTPSTDFPTTTGAFQMALGGFFDAFVAKLNPAGSQRVFITYLGGTAEDAALGIAVGGDLTTYVVGRTQSSDFPKTSGARRT